MAESLEHLATLIACEAPVYRGKSLTAHVPWDLVERIRKELDRRGFDWKDCVVKSNEGKSKKYIGG